MSEEKYSGEILHFRRNPELGYSHWGSGFGN